MQPPQNNSPASANNLANPGIFKAPSQMPQDQSGYGRVGRRHISWFLFLVITWGLMALIVFKQQSLIDWWRLRSYQAPSSIARLATDTTMTDNTRRVFYVNKPQLADKANFAKQCPGNGGEETIVLGCYRTGQHGIFLLDVTDERLSGVEQVTAAHEVLHAIYDRLGREERRRIDKHLLDFYENGLKDERIKTTIDGYKKTEPNELPNEMHSIFATELANLPAPLEEHYKKYFSNRKQIASLASKYQAEFTSRKQAREQYDEQLRVLKQQITNIEADLEARQALIDSRQAELLTLRNNGNVAAYNAGVPAYNALIDAYNRDVQVVRQLVAQYNEIVEKRNAIALEESQLADELDAKTPTIKQ